MKKCIVIDCIKQSKAHGYCSSHYHRKVRYGSPLKGRDFVDRNHPELCIVDGCKNKYVAKGFCYKHYFRFKKTGNPLLTKRNIDGDGHISNDGYQTYTINKEKIHQHRRVMENYLGRKLLPFPKEIVHHIDGNKLNNDISNLQVMSASEHMKLHMRIKH